MISNDVTVKMGFTTDVQKFFERPVICQKIESDDATNFIQILGRDHETVVTLNFSDIWLATESFRFEMSHRSTVLLPDHMLLRNSMAR